MGYSPWGQKESDTTERLHSLEEIHSGRIIKSEKRRKESKRP